MSRNPLLLIIVLWLLLVLMQSLNVDYLAYDRARISHGDYWRLVTGHFIHLNNTHLLLNMLGVALVLMLFGSLLLTWQWLIALLASALTISLLIYLNLPQVGAYVGLSGVIHTLYVLGALQLLQQPKERNFAILLIIMVIFKLLTENIGQGVSLTADMIGGHVLFQAHSYGALVGLFFGLLALMAKNLNVLKK